MYFKKVEGETTNGRSLFPRPRSKANDKDNIRCADRAGERDAAQRRLGHAGAFLRPPKVLERIQVKPLKRPRVEKKKERIPGIV